MMGKSENPTIEQQWFGYGRWAAPYWFIGAEQGGSEDGPERGANAAWLRLGGGELLDCQKHHREFGDRRWHGDDVLSPKLQPTWRRLILLLLAYSNLPTTREAIRAYQASEWGKRNGDTAVLELSGCRARSFAASVDRVSFRQERIAKLRRKLRQSKPVFVVCYCKTCKRDYEEIIGGPFGTDGYAVQGRTLFALVPFPNRPSSGKDIDWIRKGQGIKVRCLDLEARRGI